MAKIAEYLKQILSARYGRDVRQSIHDAISAINDESTECWATVEKVPETLAIAAVKDRVSGKDITLPMSSDFVATDFKAGGNTEQDTTSGKNLLDCSGLTTVTKNGGTFTPVYSDNGELEYVIVNGLFTAQTDYVLNSRMTFDNTDSRIFSTQAQGSDKTIFAFVSTDGQLVQCNDTEVSFTPLSESAVYTCHIRVRANQTISNMKFYPMIRLATITDGTYEPFTNGASPNPQFPQEIKSVVLSEIQTCGKNLAESHLVNSLKDQYQRALWAELEIKPSTEYVVSFKGTAGNRYYFNEQLFSNAINITVVSGITKATVTTVDTISKDNASQYTKGAGWGILKNSITQPSDSVFSDLMISYEDVDYEPYTESVATLSNPITLNGLNGVWDNLDGKKFKEVTFNGSENWTVSTSLSGRYVIHLSDAKEQAKLLCTQASHSAGTELNCCSITGVGDFYINTSFAALADWKAHLASKPMTVVYELAEPIETPLPDADVEALKNIRTFKGTTHVFTDSEVKPDLEVEYVIDTKLYIDAKFAEMQ